MGAFSSISRHFVYDVEGEIFTKPTNFIFQFSITNEAKSSDDSIKVIKQIVENVEKDLKVVSELKPVLTPANLGDHYEVIKIINVLMFSNEKDLVKSTMSFFLNIEMSNQQDYWTRATNLSRVYEMLRSYVFKYKGHKTIEFSLTNAEYIVGNKEKYREEIGKLIINNAMEMEKIFSINEQRKCRIAKINCSQEIIVKVLNIDKAALSMKASIDYEFVS